MREAARDRGNDAPDTLFAAHAAAPDMTPATNNERGFADYRRIEIEKRMRD
ncbi:hypothetical protein Bpla01_63710 [Burkholderia plantarii]|nr:hypothetical protein Bpla01_63710 [Burkholderia plantarii]